MKVKIQRYVADSVFNVLIDTLKKDKQAIVFVSTRRTAEVQAERFAKILEKYKFVDLRREEMESISEEALKVLESPTKQCKRLSDVLKQGIAFHHSGLAPKQRLIVEDNFRNGKIKVIFSTPTLAFGLNLPAFRVIIKDIKRYNYEYGGSEYIPIMEYLQFIGRAGRPGLEDFGEAILVAPSPSEKEYLEMRYINGSPEEIESKFASKEVFRTYLLSIISINLANTKEKIVEFFKKTLFYYQRKSEIYLRDLIEKNLSFLEKEGFIENKEGRLEATKIGKRVAELYLDPLTASRMIRAIKRLNNLVEEEQILLVLTFTDEMKPYVGVKQKEFFEIAEEIESLNNPIVPIPNAYDIEFEDIVRAYKTALLFKDWIDEVREDLLLEKYNLRAGDFYGKQQIIDWLAYAAIELSRLLGNEYAMKVFYEMRIRLKHGIRKELVELVQVKGLGRVRARQLYNAGIKSIIDLKLSPIEEIAKILKSEKIAKKIKEELSKDGQRSIDHWN